MNNPNFLWVKPYNRYITKELILNSRRTDHIELRNTREKKALELDEGSKIDKVFLVDKGHKDGEEIHVVTTNGIIYILNKYKYESNKKALITILIARPNQIKRLYNECGLWANKEILNKCYENQLKGYNKL